MSGREAFIYFSQRVRSKLELTAERGVAHPFKAVAVAVVVDVAAAVVLVIVDVAAAAA